MIKRTLLISSLVLAGVSCALAQYASTEVALVADGGQFFTDGLNAKIDRYDTVTGQYLGSFGHNNLINPEAITVSGSTCYVADVYTPDGQTYNTKIDKFNWSTGAFLGSLYSPTSKVILALKVYGNSLIAADYGNPSTGAAGSLQTYDLTTSQEIAEIPFASNREADTVTTIGDQIYIGASNNGFYSGTLSSTGTVPGGLTRHGSTPTYALAGFTSRSGASQLFGSTTAGLVQTDTLGNIQQNISEPNFYSALEFGHNGSLMALQRQGGPSLDFYDANAPLFFGPTGNMKLTDTLWASSFAIYAAPEPMPLAAFGLGVLAVAVRRRRRYTK